MQTHTHICMTSPRSDTAYNYWREASDKFDYYVTGLTGALAAYIGQALRPVPLGVNPQTVELVALVLLVTSVVFGFKRIETSVHIFQVQAKHLYAQEVAGSSMAATQQPISINTQTGELFSAAQLLQRSKSHSEAAAQLEPVIDHAIKRATWLYRWRNDTLFLGFGVLVAARLLPAYIP